ncbi:MAG: HlyD family efflux transporter periplasmic adaptor subunit [Planctomycetes bacterium]|nr:HlyD family efflux transporter periplasmic adaptor subunit [Planctomycetota bacterium]
MLAQLKVKDNMNRNSGLPAGLICWALALSSNAAEPQLSEPIQLASCRVMPAEQATLSIGQSGILQFAVREGEAVSAGQVVFRLQENLATAALAIAEKESANDVECRYAEITSDVARLEYEQAVEINGTIARAISLSDVRRRKLEFDRSLMQIEMAKHQHAVRLLKRDEAVARLATFRVQAPFDGVVTRVIKHKGESVQQGEAVAELLNTRRVRIEGFVSFTQRQHVSVGMPIRVKSVQPDAHTSPVTLTGEIMFVDVVAQPVTRQVRIWAEVDNSHDELVPGLPVAAELTRSE